MHFYSYLLVNPALLIAETLGAILKKQPKERPLCLTSYVQSILIVEALLGI